jgi:iron-sulfur cluster assembly accessory protein
MLHLTGAAMSKAKQFIEAEGKDGCGLRIAVKGGGCSGYKLGLSLVESQKPDDQVLEFDGVHVFVDPTSSTHLKDVTIDFEESLQGSGFTIKNPNSAGSCGCGESFSV